MKSLCLVPITYDVQPCLGTALTMLVFMHDFLNLDTSASRSQIARTRLEPLAALVL